MSDYLLQLGTPGKDQIVGMSRKPGHVGWIELTGYSVGSQTPISPAGRGTGKSPFTDVVCTRRSGDALSPVIAHAVTTGRTFSQAILAITSMDVNRTFRIHMRDVVVFWFRYDERPDPEEAFLLDYVPDGHGV